MSGAAEVAELQRALARVCFGREIDPADLARLGGERAAIYRGLVRSRLRDLIAVALPETERALGREATSALFADFLAESPPSSRYFREVIPAFLDFVLPRLAGPTFPEHARDLARLEGTRWELGWRDGAIEGDLVEIDLEKVPVAHPTLRVLALSYAVHRGPPEGGAIPEKGSFFVSVHRRPDFVVETRTLDATGARLVRAWSRGDRTAIEAVRSVLEEERRAADAAFVERMGALLSALVASGAILGSRP